MINKIYLCLNVEKPTANKVAQDIELHCEQFNMTTVAEPEQADCVISIGGDGTFLYASRIAL